VVETSSFGLDSASSDDFSVDGVGCPTDDIEAFEPSCDSAGFSLEDGFSAPAVVSASLSFLEPLASSLAFVSSASFSACFLFFSASFASFFA
jgi:hypothetical protein